MKTLLIFALALILLSCGDPPSAPAAAPSVPSNRFTIERVSTFRAGKDGDGAHPMREIFVITDTATKKQYLGVSDVGMVELPTTAAVER